MLQTNPTRVILLSFVGGSWPMHEASCGKSSFLWLQLHDTARPSAVTATDCTVSFVPIEMQTAMRWHGLIMLSWCASFRRGEQNQLMQML